MNSPGPLSLFCLWLHRSRGPLTSIARSDSCCSWSSTSRSSSRLHFFFCLSPCRRATGTSQAVPPWYDILLGVAGFIAAGYIALRFVELGTQMFFHPARRSARVGRRDRPLAGGNSPHGRMAARHHRAGLPRLRPAGALDSRHHGGAPTATAAARLLYGLRLQRDPRHAAHGRGDDRDCVHPVRQSC